MCDVVIDVACAGEKRKVQTEGKELYRNMVLCNGQNSRAHLVRYILGRETGLEAHSSIETC